MFGASEKVLPPPVRFIAGSPLLPIYRHHDSASPMPIYHRQNHHATETGLPPPQIPTPPSRIEVSDTT
jgi:hypothetical protein